MVSIPIDINSSIMTSINKNIDSFTVERKILNTCLCQQMWQKHNMEY